MADKDPFLWPPEDDKPATIPVAPGQVGLFADLGEPAKAPTEDEKSQGESTSEISPREGNQV